MLFLGKRFGNERGIMHPTRPAAVAGTFYPANPSEIASLVTGYLGAVDPQQSTTDSPKCLIVPHAGFIYSGAVAALGYRLLEKRAESVSRVVLIGPPHRMPVNGIALPECAAFSTPLGTVPLDLPALQQLEQHRLVSRFAAAHESEHSLEVQLPFLQLALAHFQLLPLIVGHCSAEAVAEILDLLWGGDETLIVCSTDLSHYHPYDTACLVDQKTCARITQAEASIQPEEACGCSGLNGLLVAAKRRGLMIRQLGYCNSGDTAGPKEGVVGYGAFAIG